MLCSKILDTQAFGHTKCYFLRIDQGNFHSKPSGLLSFNKSETVLWTIAKILYYIIKEIVTILDCEIRSAREVVNNFLKGLAIE